MPRGRDASPPDRRVPESVRSVLDRPGSPLPAADRALMESRFGHDFRNVRIFDDRDAARSAAEIGASAYSFGDKVVFARDRYRAGDPRGLGLLAHELTHVVQAGPTSAGDRPVGIAAAQSAPEAEAAAESRAFDRGEARRSGPSARPAPGLVHRQPDPTAPDPAPAPTPAPPTNTPAPPTTDPAPTPAPDPQQAAPDLKTRVRTFLDAEQFDLPLIADPANVKDGDRHCTFSENPWTLDKVTDNVTDYIGQTTPGLKRGDVWSEVWQYYNEKKLQAEQDLWQTNIQILYTPTLTLGSSQAGAAGSWQQSLQASYGKNYRFHPQGASGPEATFQANVSLFSLGDGDLSKSVFQNATGSAQLQQVWNVAQIDPVSKTLLQASIFAQIAAGVGGSYADSAGKPTSLSVGFLAQGAAGGQVNLNIGWFQVIAQGAIVFSYLSPTTRSGSTDTTSSALQLGLGVGAQF